jgi:putative transposase
MKKFRPQHVVTVLEELLAVRGRPQYIRSDDGPEFACQAVPKWLQASEVGTLFIKPGNPWETGGVEMAWR